MDWLMLVQLLEYWWLCLHLSLWVRNNGHGTKMMIHNQFKVQRITMINQKHLSNYH